MSLSFRLCYPYSWGDCYNVAETAINYGAHNTFSQHKHYGPTLLLLDLTINLHYNGVNLD